MKQAAKWGALVLLGTSALFAGDDSAVNLVDTLWVMMAGFLVFFMNAGFAMVESGFCRAKNVVNILAKNFAVFAIAGLIFWAVGYGIMFGQGNVIIGMDSFLVDESSNNPVTNIPLFAFFFFQMAFAATAGSIISGAVAERIKFYAYIVFTVIMIAVIYPMIGHWIWGGGWLSKLGFHDFAGSTVVHSVGGWAALAGIIVLGPRIGKFRADGTPKAIMGHSIPLAVLGTFILWLGWFGFNAGSTLAMNLDVPRIALITALGASAGLLSSMAVVSIRDGKTDLSMVVNGSLAGLVAVTAGCAVFSPVSAIIVGTIAGILVAYLVPFFDKLKIDDPVGALAVHLGNGIWGTLAVGLFASADYLGGSVGAGLFMGGSADLLVKQIIGVASVGATVFGLSMIGWTILNKTMGIRVSREEEIGGLDIGEMGMEGYKGFQIFTTED